jgi:hypothetical protein
MDLMAEISASANPTPSSTSASTPALLRRLGRSTHRRGVLLATFDYFDPDTSAASSLQLLPARQVSHRPKKLSFSLNADAGVAGRTPRRQPYLRCSRQPARAPVPLRTLLGALVGIEEAHIWLRAIK